jgi:phage tail-like protein
MAAGGKRGPVRSINNDPYTSFRFTAEIDGVPVSGFSEVTGLTLETNVETFREGGDNFQEHQLPGPTKFPSRLVLKRGLADADALWSWYQEVMKGSIKRKTIKIKLLELANVEQHTWQWIFSRACPVKWTGPDFKAGTAEVAFESIELVHGGLANAGEDSGRKK